MAEFAADWLGRDPASGAERTQPRFAEVAPARLAEITAAPRLYGFHATLKAPFEPAAGVEAPDVHGAVRTLAARRRAFELPLVLGSLGGFLALVPAIPSPELDALAAACVTELDKLRAPLSEAELARRRRSKLTPAEDAYLLRWGYPYVLEQFRCHLTLTERLAEPEHSKVRALLERLTAPFCADPFPVTELCVFEQPVPHAPFLITGRYPLTG